MDEPLLAKFYRALPLEQVKKTYFEIAENDSRDALHFLADCARLDPLVLAWVLWPKYEWEWFHREWVEHVIFNKRSLLLGPRDHAKSTCTTRLLVPWALINNRDLRCVVISASWKKALKFSNPCRRFFANKFIIEMFGDMRSSEWTKEEFSLCGRSPELDDASVKAYGPDGGLTSSHPDFLLFDDAIDITHKHSADKRAKFKDFVGMTVEPSLEPWTQYAWVGTRYHVEDYYADLEVQKWPVNASSRRCFLDEEDMPIQEMKQCLWPKKFQPKFFHDKLAAIGEGNFRAQYFNDCSGLTGNIWRPEMFRRTLDAHQGPVIIGVDTAYRMGTRNDYSAICVVRKDMNTGGLIVEHAEQGKWGGQILKDRIVSIYHKYAARLVVVEDWAANKKVFQDRMYLVQDLKLNCGIPCISVRPKVDKVTRYHNIVAFWETGSVLHRQGLHELEKQMLAAPDLSSHDDLIDALELAVSWHMTQGVSKHPVQLGHQQYSSLSELRI